MRLVAVSAVVGLASVLLAAGCDGSRETTNPSTGRTGRVEVDDLRMLVTVSPAATDWPWNVEPQTRVASPPSELDASNPSYVIQKILSDAYDEAGLVRRATSSWFDAAKKASSFANLVATSTTATTALAAEYEFARSWFRDFEHQEIRDVEVEGVGEDSWAVRGGRGDASFIEIGGTRANVVLAVYVTCNPCQSDLTEAARRWAETIDVAAREAAD
jgi:hypothetical protein